MSEAKAFAPAVRIDWRQRFVEVDAEVALREGPLELLVCSENTREHESVFVTRARPVHVYQALGLLGAEPGQPPTYDSRTHTILPPSGDSVNIRVRWEDSPIGDLRPPEEFLLQTADHKPPARLRWVFAGSRSSREGRFAADDDGTVVCVVDFDSALIAVDASHSADNELLWLEANPATIPARGTRCTLLLSPERSK